MSSSAQTDDDAGQSFTEIMKAWDLETKEVALREIAACDGSLKQAVEALAAKGIQAERGALKALKNYAMPAEYRRICTELASQKEEAQAAEHEYRARQALDAEEVYLRRAKKELPNVPARDLPGAVRNFATAAGIHSDKARVLRGQPTTITETRSAQDIVRRLVEMKVLEAGALEPFVDSTAEVISES